MDEILFIIGSLSENKLFVTVLLSTVLLIIVHFIFKIFYPDVISEETTTATESKEKSVEMSEIHKKIPSFHDKLPSFHSGMSGSDPVNDYLSGDKKNLPFQCPFFQAFKLAKDKKDKDDEEVEFIKKAEERRKKEKEAESKDTKDNHLDAKVVKSGQEKSEAEYEKKSLLKEIQVSEYEKRLSQLGPDEIKKEEEVMDMQLEEIYKLLAAQNDKLGMKSKEELHAQLRLYAH